MAINLSLLKYGDRDVKNFNTPLIQLNQGKEDKIPLPSELNMTLTSDLQGNKSWIKLLSLGTSNTTAFRGDYGQIAYIHSQSPHNYLATTGGTLTGDISLPNNKINIGTNNISSNASNIIINTNGFCELSGLGLKLRTSTIKDYSDELKEGIVIGNKTTNIILGKNLDTTYHTNEAILDSNLSNIFIKPNLRTTNISATALSVGRISINNQGFFIDSTKIIDENGNISGANVDMTPDYESPWIYVSANQEIIIPHNIGTRPKFTQIIFSTNNSNDENKTVYTIPQVNTTSHNYWWYWWYGWEGYGADAHTFIHWYNNINYCIKTGFGGVYNNGDIRHTSGYVKVLLWK